MKCIRTETWTVVADFRERERDWSGVRPCQEALKIEVFIFLFKIKKPSINNVVCKRVLYLEQMSAL